MPNYLEAKFEAGSAPGNESTNPTLSTKQIFFPAIEFSPELNPSHLDRSDEMRNVLEPISRLSESYAPEWSMESRAYPDLLGFVLKMMLGPPVTTAGNGVITDPDTIAIPTGAYRHVFTAPFGPSGAYPQTTQFQAAYADESFFLKAKGAAAAELNINSPEEGGVRVEANGLATFIDDIADPALSPTYESLSIPPFERGHLRLSPAGPSGTATTEDFGLTIAQDLEVVRSLAIASKYPDIVEKGEGPITVAGSIPKRHIDVDDWNALVAATGFTLTARWQSTAFITGAYAYALWYEANNAQYVGGGPQALANQRRIGAEFEWAATYAGTAGSSKFTLVNSVASYG